jgi:para-aminobenzoate synthetase component I
MAGHSIAHISVHLAHRQTLEPARTDAHFLTIARQVAVHPFCSVLLSGGSPAEEREGRYSLAAWDPFLIFTAKGTRCQIKMGDSIHCMEEDPLSVLDGLMRSLQPVEDWFAPPFAGGAVGYFAYDLKNVIERLPQRAEDECFLPDLWLMWPKQMIIHDRLNQSTTHLVLRYDHGRDSDPSGNLALQPTDSARGSSTKIGPLQSNFTRAEYMEAVRKVREYIGAGDVYQVNLSQRYRFAFSGDAFSLWESMFSLNPAAFYAYLHCGDHKILSTSMERFLYKNGDVLETRPIKGTRRRGNTPAEDEALRMDLLSNPKDAAELSMIVDLLRNDLGRVCIPKSVRVVEHKRLESYHNVHHLVSIVTGRVNPEISFGEIVRATFPGGSITGCPKIRAMEIIDELESVVRHVYTGSIGYLGWHGNMDLNIAIRTALIHNDVCHFSVGGGIVFDSDDADEYEETLHKGRTFFDIIQEIG